MKTITIHEAKLAMGFALVGAVVAGFLFSLIGASEYAEPARFVSAIVSVALAKHNHAF